MNNARFNQLTSPAAIKLNTLSRLLRELDADKFSELSETCRVEDKNGVSWKKVDRMGAHVVNHQQHHSGEWLLPVLDFPSDERSCE